MLVDGKLQKSDPCTHLLLVGSGAPWALQASVNHAQDSRLLVVLP